MKFNTVEGQADTIFKLVLKQLWLEYSADNDGAVSFDVYLWENLPDLGEAFYDIVGEYFGDADTAVRYLGLGE